MAQPRRWTEVEMIELTALVVTQSGKRRTLGDLAAALNFSEDTIRRAMIDAGIPRLPRGRPKGRCNGRIPDDAEPCA